jgi:hypothetical protein
MRRLRVFAVILSLLYLPPLNLHASAGLISKGEKSIGLSGAEAAGKGAGQAFDSFSAFKRAMGPAGENMQWHHLVEQNPTNIAQFGQRALQTTDNLIPLSTPLHQRISGFYSSIRPDVTGSLTPTVRQWVSTQGFEAKAQFGQSILSKVISGVAP